MGVSESLHYTELLVLAAIECDWQTGEELLELTERCDKTVRMGLYKSQGQGPESTPIRMTSAIKSIV